MKFPCMIAGAAVAALSISNAGDFIMIKERPLIQSPDVTEASGLAASPSRPGFLWVINDSGGTSEIHLMDETGSDCGKVAVSNAKNIDWEDLASFTLNGQPYLLVADTGDNGSVRKKCTLHILREPKLPPAGQKLSGKVAAEWHIDFTYEGGPRDCESAAVDVAAGKIILISKRTTPPEVYELPLRAPNKRGDILANKVGTVLVDSPAGTLLPFASQPVGFDINEDRSMAAVVTYYGVFLFSRKEDESWKDAFSRKPISLGPHEIGQAESVAFSKDGKSIFVTAEGKKAPVVRYRR
jgi:hypothetical protein